MDKWKNSSWLIFAGFVSGAINLITSASDVMWLCTFALYIGGYVVRAIEDLKEVS